MPAPPPTALGEADPWAGSEPFLAGLPDPWAESQPFGGAPATPRSIADRFDPAAPPPPPPPSLGSPMRAPKQGALPSMRGGASGAPPNLGPALPPSPAPPSPRALGAPGSGRGQLPAEAELPAWLFDRPSDWQAPGMPPGGAADAWPPPAAGPFSPEPGGAADQGPAWPAPPPVTDGWDAPGTGWGRASATPRAPAAGRGHPTPLGAPGPAGLGGLSGLSGQGWGSLLDAPPPPAWNRPPAPPSEPLGTAWPSVAPLVAPARPRKRGWSLPALPALPFGRGKGAGKGSGAAGGNGKAPRRPVLSRRLARGGEIPTGGPGWRIVTPINEANPAPASFLAPSAAPRGPSQRLALITGLSRLTFNLVLLGIIIAILAIPISIGLSRLASQRPSVVATLPVSTPRPIPTPYPNSKAFTTDAFVLDYPATWKQGTFQTTLQDAGGVSGTTFQMGGNVTFAIATFPAQPENVLQDILSAGLIPVVPGNADSVSPVQTPQPGPTLDGVRWLTEQYTFNLVSGRQTARMRAVALVATRGDTSYLIVYQAPDAQFGSDTGPYFQPMLTSFRFRP